MGQAHIYWATFLRCFPLIFVSSTVWLALRCRQFILGEIPAVTVLLLLLLKSAGKRSGIAETSGFCQLQTMFPLTIPCWFAPRSPMSSDQTEDSSIPEAHREPCCHLGCPRSTASQPACPLWAVWDKAFLTVVIVAAPEGCWRLRVRSGWRMGQAAWKD